MNDPFEGERRMAALLERGSAVPEVLRARALRVNSEAAFVSGDFTAAAELLEQSLSIFQALGDERAVTVLLQRIAVSALLADDLPGARRLLEESLARCRIDPNPKLEADIVHKLGWVERGEGNRERALELFEEGAVLCGQVGFTWMQASALMDAADLSHELGRTAVAVARGREALRLAEELADRRSIVYSLAWLARFAAADGRIDEAGRLWGAIEAEELRGPIGAWAQEREQFAAAILTHGGPELETARSAGQRLSLDGAVRCALGSLD